MLPFLSSCDLSLGALEAPTAPPLRVVSSSLQNNAQDVPLNQPITLGFNQYLDADALDIFGSVEAHSGGIRARAFVRYRVVDRSLTYYPVRNLEPDLVYRLTLDEETLLSVQGAGLDSSFERRFQTASQGTVPQERSVERLSFEETIAPVFEASCGCHNDARGLNPLRYSSLVGVPSGQRESALLVRPFDPPRSYLLMKMLPNYPGRRLERMPPSWSNEPPLDRQALRLIEDWIATGASP